MQQWKRTAKGWVNKMARNLIANEQQILKIFSDDYVFTIPGYQRPYSWKIDNAQELVDDLVGFMQGGTGKVDDLPSYFLGSIVLIKDEAKPEAIVVDGQQRLATLTLLLSAIRAQISDEKAKKGISKRIPLHALGCWRQLREPAHSNTLALRS